jgi:hypothetical protein
MESFHGGTCRSSRRVVIYTKSKLSLLTNEAFKNYRGGDSTAAISGVRNVLNKKSGWILTVVSRDRGLVGDPERPGVKVTRGNIHYHLRHSKSRPAGRVGAPSASYCRLE